MPTGTSSAVDDIWPATPRLPELDGLRAVAVLLVIQLHWIVHTRFLDDLGMRFSALESAMQFGWSGVDLFFVLSGFLIGGILIDQRKSPNLFRVFFTRRALRILPIYYLLLVVLALLPPAWFGRPREIPLWAFFVFIQNFFTSFGFLPGRPFGPLWSIAIEEQFYLVAPAVARAVSRSSAKILLAVAIVAPPLLRLAASTGGSPAGFSIWEFTPARIDGIALGVAGAWLVRSPVAVARLTQARQVHRIALVGLGLGALVLTQLARTSMNLAVLTSVGISYLSIFFLALLLYVVLHARDSLTARALRFPALVLTGRVSYFLYLFHIPALIVVLQAGARSAAIVLPAAALLLGLGAWISWRWFESPLIAVGRRSTYAPAN